MTPDAVIDIDRTVALTDDHGNEIAEIDVVCEVPVVRGRHRDDDTAATSLSEISVYGIGGDRKAYALPGWLADRLRPWFDANFEAIEAEALEKFREGGRGADRLADYRIEDRLERMAEDRRDRDRVGER